MHCKLIAFKRKKNASTYANLHKTRQLWPGIFILIPQLPVEDGGFLCQTIEIANKIDAISHIYFYYSSYQLCFGSAVAKQPKVTRCLNCLSDQAILVSMYMYLYLYLCILTRHVSVSKVGTNL